MFAKMRLFQKAATSILVIFIGLMVLVTVVAHTRKSGTTRQDMAKLQLVRKEASLRAKDAKMISQGERQSENISR